MCDCTLTISQFILTLLLKCPNNGNSKAVTNLRFMGSWMNLSSCLICRHVSAILLSANVINTLCSHEAVSHRKKGVNQCRNMYQQFGRDDSGWQTLLWCSSLNAIMAYLNSYSLARTQFSHQSMRSMINK